MQAKAGMVPKKRGDSINHRRVPGTLASDASQSGKMATLLIICRFKISFLSNYRVK